MASPVVLCADGSELSLRALAAGMALITPGTLVVIVTVAEEPDPSLVSGVGMAGGVVSAEEYDRTLEATDDSAAEVLAATQRALGLEGAESRVLRGHPGSAICQFAAEVSARAVIVGSRGRGGLKRAVLGSVSDHVVRNAPCPVIVTGDHGGAEIA